MAKKFSTKDVKIVTADAEAVAAVEETSPEQGAITADLVVGSTVSQDGKSGTVIWEGHQSGNKKIKVKWEDGSMSFHLFES